MKARILSIDAWRYDGSWSGTIGFGIIPRSRSRMTSPTANYYAWHAMNGASYQMSPKVA